MASASTGFAQTFDFGGKLTLSLIFQVGNLAMVRVKFEFTPLLLLSLQIFIKKLVHHVDPFSNGLCITIRFKGYMTSYKGLMLTLASLA